MAPCVVPHLVSGMMGVPDLVPDMVPDMVPYPVPDLASYLILDLVRDLHPFLELYLVADMVPDMIPDLVLNIVLYVVPYLYELVVLLASRLAYCSGLGVWMLPQGKNIYGGRAMLSDRRLEESSYKINKSRKSLLAEKRTPGLARFPQQGTSMLTCFR